ncbi:replication initiation protein RepC [Bradyrhizobium diazoefficiens]|uniref:plasmid replication protein RepC n=1 Tax=Bradyrhizobium diazoefficiens TaxID=1355477 RepID=UPI001B8A99B9|nr:plasmid replication protein RepC [Bradyrhizobium diazoefficiens]MBR0866690.1 replication initiation protein RepC [Bradyrhizobium diazoefficiens]MBR0891098.1 replication initiation protein RepC [Bradyrhizobium diazoefficiens]MBR0922827.1 replication initiation protein RepC [Bradyrhizobium diazoefficiens]
MQTHVPTTPFGRRSLTLAHVASQIVATTRPPEKVVHKWRIYQAICLARPKLGVSERSLSVLNALLTFHPETALTGEDDLIVFPSNVQLSLRAHGMPISTLKRHLAALVDAGLIVRRDSPNGKRYVRKGWEGESDRAFGFDISPLVARSEEIEGLAEEIAAGIRAVKLARERITLCRRDIAKMIATGIEEGVPADWPGIHVGFRVIVDGIPRSPTLEQLQEAADTLSQLADDVLGLLKSHVKTSNLDPNEAHSEPHKQSSNPNLFIDLEPASREGGTARAVPDQQTPRGGEERYPLGMVLQACGDLADYAKNGQISNWRDFLATAAVARPILGISPSAWEAAQRVMGEVQAAIVVACILERSATINSAGGYLRGLTAKAAAGEFSLGPILMAQINARLKKTKMRADS